jgi:ubiquitin-like 1-activating enzyme E1 B
VPLQLDAIHSVAAVIIDKLTAETVEDSSNTSSTATGRHLLVPSLQDCLYEFMKCIVELGSHAELSQLIGQLSFDKDDDWSMRFVCAASNLRATIFSIPCLSFHDAKGIAGNIVPAIATTNAIVAGCQVAAALRYLTTCSSTSSTAETAAEGATVTTTSDSGASLRSLFPHVYCTRHSNRRGLFLQPSTADEPSPNCYVCGAAQLHLLVDTHHTSLNLVVNKVLKQKLGFNAPSVTAGNNLLYEEGEDADEDLQANLPLMLSQCPGGGVHHGSLLQIADYTQDLEMQLAIEHRDLVEIEALSEAAKADLFVLSGQHELLNNATVANKQQTRSTSDNGNNNAGIIEDDDVVMIIEPEAGTTLASSSASDHRKRDAEEISNTNNQSIQVEVVIDEEEDKHTQKRRKIS